MINGEDDDGNDGNLREFCCGEGGGGGAGGGGRGSVQLGGNLHQSDGNYGNHDQPCNSNGNYYVMFFSLAIEMVISMVIWRE